MASSPNDSRHQRPSTTSSASLNAVASSSVHPSSLTMSSYPSIPPSSSTASSSTLAAHPLERSQSTSERTSTSFTREGSSSRGTSSVQSAMAPPAVRASGSTSLVNIDVEEQDDPAPPSYSRANAAPARFFGAVHDASASAAPSPRAHGNVRLDGGTDVPRIMSTSADLMDANAESAKLEWDEDYGSDDSVTNIRTMSTYDKGPVHSLRVPLLNRPYSPSSESSSGGTASRNRRATRRRRSSRHPRTRLETFVATSGKIYGALFGSLHPLIVVAALALLGVFIFSLVKLIAYIRNPDKEHVPYRQYCAMQPDFPHAAADALEPVDVFVGVFSVAPAYERRHLIRKTYAAHSLPIDPTTGSPSANIQVKFIMGRPKKKHVRRVALEMEMFNDIVILDIEENMNKGKTHSYFQWAAENATVPIMVEQPLVTPTKKSGHRQAWGQHAVGQDGYQVRWKKADFVVKADDDAFIVLEELERHLRVAPRQMTYWGYLIRDLFMAGECYALSSDLVQYAAKSSEVAAKVRGNEDQVVARWMRMHPESSRINWVSERCWIYDHAKASTAYSHGYLFPDEVKRIKEEFRRGLSDQEMARRGGAHKSLAYSSVSQWKVPYTPPQSDLTIEEEVEALVEGGGRWSTWTRDESSNNTQPWFDWDQVVYEANDTRLFGPTGAPPILERNLRPLNQRTVRGLASDGALVPRQRTEQPHLLSLPTPKEGYPYSGPDSAAALRARRYLGRPHGGTVVVHFLKQSEWFMETAIALLGRDKLWVGGAGGAGSEWRMWGPSLVREGGYVAAGRSQPRRTR